MRAGNRFGLHGLAFSLKVSRWWTGVGTVVAAAGFAAGFVALHSGALPEAPPPPGAWLLTTPQPLTPADAWFRPRPSMRGLGWRVSDYRSALGVLIVEVETHRLAEALGIARALIHPLEDSYGEVLVYFIDPGREMASLRVQWTPSGGYVKIDLRP